MLLLGAHLSLNLFNIKWVALVWRLTSVERVKKCTVLEYFNIDFACFCRHEETVKANMADPVADLSSKSITSNDTTKNAARPWSGLVNLRRNKLGRNNERHM